MAQAKEKRIAPSNNEVRALMLRYFYERNRNATSAMGKKGSAVKISDVKAELKAAHGLTQQEVQSNLTYLISEGWVEEKSVDKQFQTKGGAVIPASTSYYLITAAGIDKIDGEGEFTMPKFHGIKIEATGQNIITVGDGNQVDARYGTAAEKLAELREAITNSNVTEGEKLSYVADIDTIQSQLAKPTPSNQIIAFAWRAIQGASAIAGCAELVHQVAGLLGPFLQ